jgi:hypothetical protein
MITCKLTWLKVHRHFDCTTYCKYGDLGKPATFPNRSGLFLGKNLKCSLKGMPSLWCQHTHFQLLMFSITARCIVSWHNYRPPSLCNSFSLQSRHCIWWRGSALSSCSTIILDSSLKKNKCLLSETFMKVLLNSTDMIEWCLLF